jgi:hypothetical protein
VVLLARRAQQRGVGGLLHEACLKR